MSDDFQLNTSILKQRFPSQSATHKNELNLNIKNPSFRNVYRNNTTTEELLVKQIKNKITIKDPNNSLDETDMDSLYQEIQNLKTELNSVHRNFEMTKKCFRVVMFEMGKQLEAANQSDLKRQTKNLILQLEKEKLKTILASKTNLVSKLRKELVNMKRTIKIVSKSVRKLPYMVENVNSDSEYTEFENDLLKPKKNVENSAADERITSTSMYETTKSSNI